MNRGRKPAKSRRRQVFGKKKKLWRGKTVVQTNQKKGKKNM